MKLENKLIIILIAVTILAVIFKVIKIMLPILLTGAVAITALTVKAYIGRVMAKKVEKVKKKILGE